MLFFEKLLTARRLLALSQKEASEQAGINQATLSILEKGERKFIPTEYLQFLYKKGIDINWIIDENNRTDNIFHHNFLPNDRSDKRPRHLLGLKNGEDTLRSLIPESLISKKSAVTNERTSVNNNEQELGQFFKEVLQELKKMNENLQLVAH